MYPIFARNMFHSPAMEEVEAMNSEISLQDALKLGPEITLLQALELGPKHVEHTASSSSYSIKRTVSIVSRCVEF